MTQPSLLDAPDLSAHVSGLTPHARHASYQGAKEAELRAGKKLRALLRWYETRGEYGATDHETQARFEWPMSSCCSMRNLLIQRGFVEDSGDTRPGPYHATRGVTVWRRKA